MIFYTNGYEHWLWDDATYPPRPVQGFLKKDELALMIQRRETKKSLGKVEIDTDIAGRFYQTRAIRRIGEVFEKDHMRKALLVMATGSGKTRTVIALADVLMRANWAKRVLFLADRVALVNQAVGAFKTHLPYASPVNLVTDKKAEGRVYLSTYPTMMGQIDELEGGVRRFGAGHFDLIVIDEAHRSVYKKYKAIFDHFDSLLVGLTATPRDEIDRDTYGLFGLQSGVPTDVYDLDDAVADGFLVPYRAVSVPLKFQREGIKYDDLSDDDKERWDALEWTEDGQVPAAVGSSELNKWLFNKDTVDKVLEHLMTHGVKVAGGDRLGKTIIFAKNHDHAQFIAERFDANYPHLKGAFARVIDFKTEYAQSLIDAFSEPEKGPHIAISVDMLDTGIDVPEVMNLVFFKAVRSKTKFWQMVGRGTRLRPDLFGPGEDKEFFQIFDFCQNFEFFGQNPDLVDGAGGASLSEKLFRARLDLVGALEPQSVEGVAEAPKVFETDGPSPEDQDLAARRDILKGLIEEVAGMSLNNFIVRPHRRLIEKYQAPAIWEVLTAADRAELADNLAGLPTSVIDDDVAAKQFDLLVYSMELAMLRKDKAFAKLQAKVRDLVSQLEELSNVPMVAAQMPLIFDIQTDGYWQDITVPMLEEARRKLRGLIKLIEPRRRKIVVSDFEDEIGEGVDISLPGGATATDKNRFQRKVRHFLEGHMDHITIQKLRRDEPLTSQDVAELERIFLDEDIATSVDLDQVRADGGLGLFIRSLVGLDREAAKRALGGFTQGRALTPNQIEFIDLIVNYLTERGAMEPSRLYESPFTDMDDMGVSGLFQPAEVKELVRLINEVKSRAAA